MNMPLTPDGWNNLLASSRSKTVVIFKHSPACSVSTYVLDTFRDFVSDRDALEYAVVDVIGNRELSNDIAQRMAIPHESPQVIAIANEQPVWSASHWAIDLVELDRVLPGPTRT